MGRLIKFNKQEQDNKQELQDINIIHTYKKNNVVNSIVLIKNNLARIELMDYLDNQKSIYNMFDYGVYWLFIIQQIKTDTEDNK